MAPSDNSSYKIPTRAAKKTAQANPRHELGPLPEKRAWLVAGEYSTGNRAQLVARWWLIKAAVRKVPGFLESLRDDVYPKFAGRGAAGARILRFEQLKDKPALRDALLSWAARFHITEKDAWLLDGALRCLDRWHRSQEDCAALDDHAFKPQLVESALVMTDWPAFALIPFEFKDPGWDLFSVSFAGWLKLVHQRVEAEARAYGNNIRKSAKEAGFDKTPGRAFPEHFEWLALAWFRGRTYGEIHRGYKTRVKDRTAIQKGAARAAKLAGLNVRIARA